MTHEMDWATDFCTRCGVSRTAIANGDRPRECHATENVIGVSHLIAKRRMAPLIDAILHRIDPGAA